MEIFKEGDRAKEEEQTAIGATKEQTEPKKRSTRSQEELRGAKRSQEEQTEEPYIYNIYICQIRGVIGGKTHIYTFACI